MVVLDRKFFLPAFVVAYPRLYYIKYRCISSLENCPIRPRPVPVRFCIRWSLAFEFELHSTPDGGTEAVQGLLFEVVNALIIRLMCPPKIIATSNRMKFATRPFVRLFDCAYACNEGCKIEFLSVLLDRGITWHNIIIIITIVITGVPFCEATIFFSIRFSPSAYSRAWKDFWSSFFFAFPKSIIQEFIKFFGLNVVQPIPALGRHVETFLCLNNKHSFHNFVPGVENCLIGSEWYVEMIEGKNLLISLLVGCLGG